jgi:hypothetical protein
MKKKTNLESGFLFLYDWMPVLELLPAKEVKALLLALIARQRENKPLPTFRNPLTDSLARMIEPVIRRRLEGAMWAQKGQDPSGVPEGEPRGEPLPQKRKDKKQINQSSDIKEEGEGEIPIAPPASGTLSEKERQFLMEEGLPAAYLDARGTRAAEFASRCRRDVLDVLCEWWKKDKRSFTATQKAEAASKESSFDVDDFFQAALARTFGNDP